MYRAVNTQEATGGVTITSVPVERGGFPIMRDRTGGAVTVAQDVWGHVRAADLKNKLSSTYVLRTNDRSPHFTIVITITIPERQPRLVV